jgi:hypothetical protein
LVFTTPIGLHSDDLSTKESLNQVLEVSKALKHFRFMFKSINPHILAQVIYEAYIVFFSTNELRGRVPNIRKTKSNGAVEMLRYFGYGSRWAFSI